MNETDKLFLCMPRAAAFELERICLSRKCPLSSISEIRLRANARSCLILKGERIYLSTVLKPSEINAAFLALCDGSLYAHRDSIAEGYIALKGGIRVGVAGKARYEGARLVGISDVSSLVFRIPTEKSELQGELISAWQITKRGMLIFSSPGVGKTTALRALISYISSAKSALQVSVVDTRGELSANSLENGAVDFLSGYTRRQGMDIALRTLSPDVIVVDEIGGQGEAEQLVEYMNSGVRVIASAHGANIEQIKRRGALKPFIEADIFDLFFGISLKSGIRVANIYSSEALFI